MITLLASILSVLLFALVVLAVVVGTTAVPFVLSVDMAERRGFSAARWGTASLALLVVAAGLAKALRHDHLLLVLPLLVAWLTPLVLSLLGDEQKVIGGPQGRHEV